MAEGYDTQDFLGTDTTPEQYAYDIGVNPELLDREFPSSYDAYLRFGKLIPNWTELAHSLGLRRGEIQAIRSNLNLTDGMHEREVLKKWKSKNAFNAKYRQLVKAYLDLGDRDVAKNMCLAIQDYCGQGCLLNFNLYMLCLGVTLYIKGGLSLSKVNPPSMIYLPPPLLLCSDPLQCQVMSYMSLGIK